MTAEAPVLRECPVCRRVIRMGVTVLPHRDASLRRKYACPMSGQMAPTRWRGTTAVVA